MTLRDVPSSTDSAAARPGLSRRQILGRGAALAAALGAGPTLAACTTTDSPTTAKDGDDRGTARGPGRPAAEDGWHEPEVRSSVEGILRTRLQIATQVVDIAGRRITTQVYEGSYPGPTLVVRPGDTLEIELVNGLDQPTNLHTHGLHVSPNAPSDDVLLDIPPGGSYTYRYEIPADHPVGTYWYHPHRHQFTADQAFAGLFGALLVRGDLDELPGVAGRPERLFVIAQTDLTPQGTIVREAVSELGNEETLVNGRSRPKLAARPGEVQRWRLVNAGNVFYRLEVPGARWWVIAVDGNPLSVPDPQRVLILPPAGRYDLLVEMPTASELELRSLTWTEYGPTYSKGMVPPQAAVLADVAVGGTRGDAPGIPTTLLPVEDLRDRAVDRTRTITLTQDQPANGADLADFHFLMDGREFDPNRVDQSVELGAFEEWVIANETPFPHPIHIHVNPFQVVAMNGVPVDEPFRRDTVMVPSGGSVTIRHRFEDFAGRYVMHCHILFHEDHGMMQLIEVVDPKAPATPPAASSPHGARHG